MAWLDPWWSTAGKDAAFHANFVRQLELEVTPWVENCMIPEHEEWQRPA